MLRYDTSDVSDDQNSMTFWSWLDLLKDAEFKLMDPVGPEGHF